MPLYQVQYKKNSHTYLSDIECDSKDAVLSVFNNLVVAEVIEIREYKYTKLFYPIDDGNYNKSISFILTNDKKEFMQISIKKIKKNLSVDDISSSIKSYLKFNKKSDFKISTIKFR